MLISCEKCATTYVLDEKLIPAAGAPVQCTKCSHVFIARPGGGTEAKTEPPAAGAGQGAPVSGKATAAGQKSNSTMIFGVVKPGAAPLPGAAAALPPKPATHSTMMFGAVAPGSSPPPVAPPKTQSQTMIFGAATSGSAPAAPSPKVASSQTMIFGAAVAAAPSTQSAPPKLQSQTMIFGAKQVIGTHEMDPSETEPTGPAHHQKTQLFAMNSAAGPAAGSSAPVKVAEERSNVQLDASLLETIPPEANVSAPANVARTMIFGGPPPGLLPAAPTQKPLRAKDLARTELNLPPLSDPPGLPFAPNFAAGVEDSSAEDPSVALKQQVARRNQLALRIVIIALVAAASAIGWKLVASRLFGSRIPLAAMQGVESGLAELRGDDSISKETAVKSLADIVGAHPGFVDAHAGLVTALTVQLDDLQQRAKRLEKAAEERNLRIGRYNKEKSPSDWETRATGLASEVQNLKKTYDPLVIAARDLEARLREAYKAMQVAVQQGGELTRQAELALIRAQALFHAYGGTDEALKLSKRYQAKAEGISDGWIDLVDAEYAANTRASPELIAAAQRTLAALYERDPTFFRTYILAARLNLQAKLYDEAEENLERVQAMKPRHDIANELLEWVKKAKLEQAERNSPRRP